MARDIRGPDLSLVLVDGRGAVIDALTKGIESFSAKPLTEKVVANNLDGRRVGQVFNGWDGSIELNLRDNTAPLKFLDSYLSRLQSDEDARVIIRESVFDPQTKARVNWSYPKCTLDFDVSYAKSNPVKLKISWETGENRSRY